MLRLYFTIVFLFSTIFAWAQKIHFTDKGNTWKIRYSSIGFPDHNQTMSLANLWATIREDTVLGLVYAKPNGSPNNWLDTTEQVLYDYNLVVGDTVTRFANNYDDTFRHYVHSMDTVLINNIPYRVWNFEWVYGPPTSGLFNQPYTIVEGIGCTREPLFPLIPNGFEHYEQLICFTNRGIVSPLSKEVRYFFDNATSCTLALHETEQNNLDAAISPHPLRTHSLLKLPYSMSGTLTIHDVTGRKISEQVIAQQTEIPLTAANYLPGMYLAKFTEAGTGRYHIQKMLVE